MTARHRLLSATWIVAGLLVLAAVGGVAWRVSGGSWHRVESASMAELAPVGSLLWVQPVDIADLQVGDFITFRQPDNPAVTISHAVWQINDDGSISTKGVLPAQDPWHLTQDDLVGEVVAVWRGVGALVEALPVLIVGSLLLAALRLLTRPQWRGPVVILGVSVVLAVAVVVYQPLVGADQIADTPGDPASLTFVGTGLLPTRISDAGGGEIVLGSGEVGVLEVPASRYDTGQVDVNLSASIGWPWWVALIAMALAPATVTLCRRREWAPDDDTPRVREARASRLARAAL